MFNENQHPRDAKGRFAGANTNVTLKQGRQKKLNVAQKSLDSAIKNRTEGNKTGAYASLKLAVYKAKQKLR